MNLVSDHRLYELFHAVIYNQKLENICVPHDIFNEVNFEGDCGLKNISTFQAVKGSVMPYPTLSSAY